MHLCWSGTSLFEILDPPLWSKVNNNKFHGFNYIFQTVLRNMQTGLQMRVVECTDSNGAVVPSDECDLNLHPVSVRFCNGYIDCFRK